jgi:hypothetical protein
MTSGPRWAKESRRDVLDIWLCTQAIHVGKELEKGKTSGRFTLQNLTSGQNESDAKESNIFSGVVFGSLRSSTFNF